MPLINNNATPTEITQWKKKSEINKCYMKIFNKEKQTSILTQLLEKVFGEDDAPTLYIAFVTAIYVILLDPKSQNIQANESTMKAKVTYYMVSFHKVAFKIVMFYHLLIS